MEFKGTSGKWNIEYSNRDNSYDIYNESKEEFVCTTMNSLDINKYNALLISKAPEMLEMLERIAFEEYVSPEEAKQLIKEVTEL